MVMIGFWIVFAAFFFGLTYGLLQICTERTILHREHLVGLRLGAYVASKVTVLVPFLLLVVVAMLGVLRVLDRLPARPLSTYASIGISLLLCAIAALGLGLLTSATVGNVAQATLALPMLCFPAVLFSGAILPVHLMARAGAAVSEVIPSRWAFEAIGHDLGARRILAEGGSRLGPPLLASYGDAGTQSTGTYWFILARLRGRVPGRHVGCARAHHAAIDALNTDGRLHTSASGQPSDAIAASKSSTIFPVAIADTVPPSVFRFSPEMYDAASLLRKIIGHACSAGVERRPRPCAKRSMSFGPAMFSNAGIIGVSVGPGLMQFNRMFCAAKSCAACIVQMMSASFDCPYAPTISSGCASSHAFADAKSGVSTSGSHFSMLATVGVAGGRRDARDRTAVGHVRSDQRGEVTGSGEVDEHHVEIRERRPGQAGTVEQRVDPAPDLLDRGRDRVRVAQVGRLVAHHLDGRLLQVEHVDLGTHLRQTLDRGGAHPGTTPAAHDDTLALVAELRHLRPPGSPATRLRSPFLPRPCATRQGEDGGFAGQL